MVCAGARAGLGAHVPDRQRRAAALANAVLVDGPAAAAVFEQHRRPGGRLGVLVAPLHQGHHCGPQVEPLLGQAVFVALGTLVVEPALEHAVIEQPDEARLQDVSGDSQVLLALVEAAQPEEDVAHDQQRPALAHHLEGAGDGAGLACVLVSEHDLNEYSRLRCIMQRKWRVSPIGCAGVVMSSLDLFIVNIAFPAIGRHFGGASLGTLSWILSGYAIVFAALLVPAGRWADAFGRKRAFLLGLGIFVVASAACAAAPSVGFLIAARVVQAAGGALMLPTSLGLMLPEFEAEKRHVAIGVWAATGGIAAAAGPPLGGLLVQADWRWVFLVNVPVGLLGMITGARTLAERRELDSARPDVIGAGALIAAIGALVVAIVKGQEWGWGSPAILALLVVTAVFLPAIWWRSERHVAPIVEPAMLRVRSFGLAVGASVLFFGGFGAMLLAGVLFLTSVWHEPVLTAGL